MHLDTNHTGRREREVKTIWQKQKPDYVTHSFRGKVQVLVVIRATMSQFHVAVRLYVVLIKQHEGEQVRLPDTVTPPYCRGQ